MKKLTYLDSILKSLLHLESIEIWKIYRSSFLHTFEGEVPEFDDVIKFLNQHCERFDEFPETPNILNILSVKGVVDAQKYLEKILENASVPLLDNKGDFIARLEEYKVLHINHKTSVFLDGISSRYTSLEKTERGLTRYLEDVFEDYSKLKERLSPDNKATEFYMYGDAEIEKFKKQYQKIVDIKESDQKIFYDIPFEVFNSVSIKPGDLYITGGYTSNGKSVYLRYLSYYFAIYHCRNVLYMTLEMDAEVTTNMFYILHANNKNIFPNTPRISYSKFKRGELSEDERDFLENVVVPDFCTNSNYGVVKVYKPNKSRFTLDDLRYVIKETQVFMPLDVVSIDYLTLLFPNLKANTKSTPAMDDYNQMIKEFKQVLLTNADNQGQKNPLIGLTAAQISRQGFQECLKNNKHYSISAFSMYSEIERSADVLMTILRDAELAKGKKVRLQFLKNRDGEIPIEPHEFICDIEFGGQVLDAKEQVALSMDEILKELSISV